jgi:8-oxo-dGTP diphosphatase
MAGKRHVRVVAGLFRRGPRQRPHFLVQRRPPGKARGLLWEFPGGKVEPGETDVQALARECLEELGLRVQVGSRLHAHTHEYEDLTVHLVIYAATLPRDQEPTPDPGVTLAWVSGAELNALPLCEADRPFVACLVNGALTGA